MNRTTNEDYIDVTPQASWKWRAAKHVARLAVGCALAVGVARGVDAVTAWGTVQYALAREKVLDLVTVERVRTEVREVSELELGEIIARVSTAHGLDPLVLETIAELESGGGRALYRYEAGKFAELRKAGKYKDRSDDEVRMVASSHGPYHVMGYSAEAYCGLPWHRLYDPMTGAKCAATILGRLWADTAGVKDPGDRLRRVFVRWNGAGEAAERYGDKAMSRVAAKLYKRLGAVK